MLKAFIARNVGVGLITLITSLLLGILIYFFGDNAGLVSQNQKITALGISIVIIGLLLSLFRNRKQQLPKSTDDDSKKNKAASTLQPLAFLDIKQHLHQRHGLLWRNKIRILLVVGENAAAEAIAPGLTTQQWLEGQGTLLLWGGGVQAEPDEAWLLGLRKMRRRRPLDGVVWVMNEQQSAQAGVIDQGCRQLQKRGQILKQQAPVYLWQVCDSAWQQDDRITQPVGCLFPEKNSPEKLAASLQKLVAPLRQRGMTQVLLKNSHDFCCVWLIV